jgi:hypothetical protein
MRAYVPVLLVLTACGGNGADPVGPTTGSLEIKIATSGQTPADGYTYRVDGEPAQAIGSDATVSRADLEPGSHVVQLGGLPEGCSPGVENPQTVSIEPGTTATVDFSVTCIPPVGTIQVQTATSGPAPVSYNVVLDATPEGEIGPSETRAIEGVPSGSHSIGLSGVPANCQLAGDNPDSVTLQTGATATISFAITCVAPPPETGTLRVTIATAGVDPDGYRLIIDAARQPVGLNGAVILANLAAGNHTVRLSGLASGCLPAEPNPRQVDVAAGGTAEITFTVTCAPPPAGSILISTATTGTNVDADGYTFSLDGGSGQTIAPTAAVQLDGVAPGSHSIALSGIADGCTLDGRNPRTVTVTSGAVAPVGLAIRCAPAVSNQWTRMASGTSYSLNSIWGSSPADVFSLGEPGGRFEEGIFHFDGAAWSLQSTQPDVTLYSVWGSGPTDIFAVGTSPLGKRGYDGVILHYDGASWTSLAGPGVGTPDGSVQVAFFSVWGTSPSSVFAVGEASTDFDRGLIAHYDGSRWTEMPFNSADGRVLNDVGGTSEQDVYAVGYSDAEVSLKRKFSLSARAQLFSEGLILHYDGNAWQEVQPSGLNIAYTAVWSSAPNDVFVVGNTDDQGTILHFDGSSWTPMPCPPTGPLLDVWGNSGHDVYAVGVGTILHYDGQAWTEVLAASQRFAGVWASSPTDVFVAGSSGTVLRGTALLSTAARR